MAAPSPNLSSHGRGGAGNMADATRTPPLTAQDLETPTLKTPIVTTGRGGSGNMARNDDPRETRLRQDVEAVPRRSSHGAQHAGRGGAGNIFKGDDESVKLERKLSNEQAIEDDPKSAAAKPPSKGRWLFSKKA